jgi:esterase/lipase
MVSIENVAAISVIGTAIGGVFTYLMRSTLAPFKVLIGNCTEAMQDLKKAVETHASKIEDQGSRITAIETKHSVHHKGE